MCNCVVYEKALPRMDMFVSSSWVCKLCWYTGVIHAGVWVILNRLLRLYHFLVFTHSVSVIYLVNTQQLWTWTYFLLLLLFLLGSQTRWFSLDRSCVLLPPTDTQLRVTGAVGGAGCWASAGRSVLQLNPCLTVIFRSVSPFGPVGSSSDLMWVLEKSRDKLAAHIFVFAVNKTQSHCLS